MAIMALASAGAGILGKAAKNFAAKRQAKKAATSKAPTETGVKHEEGLLARWKAKREAKKLEKAEEVVGKAEQKKAAEGGIDFVAWFQKNWIWLAAIGGGLIFLFFILPMLGIGKVRRSFGRKKKR